MRAIVPFLIRLVLGLVFVQAGWGKITNIERVQNYFASLGIPFAVFQAPLVAALELSLGVFLILGFMVRSSAVVLSVIMVVALGTAIIPELDSWRDLGSAVELTYILLFLSLMVMGPGPWSLERKFKDPFFKYS